MNFEEKIKAAIGKLASLPEISEDIAEKLVNNGFLTIEGIKEADINDIAEIENIDADTAKSIKNAVDTLESQSQQ